MLQLACGSCNHPAAPACIQHCLQVQCKRTAGRQCFLLQLDSAPLGHTGASQASMARLPISSMRGL